MSESRGQIAEVKNKSEGSGQECPLHTGITASQDDKSLGSYRQDRVI